MPNSSHIVFGTGPLGRATATALLSLGLDVTVASRSGKIGDPPAGAKIVALDLSDTAAVTAACTGAAALYFCAAPAYHRWEQEFPALLDAVIAAAEHSGARLVIADNLYGYGIVDGPMTESLELRPNTRKGRVRTAMHDRVLAAHPAGRITYAVARGSDFFGPWVEGSAVGVRLIDAVIAGKPALFLGGTEALHSFTYVADFGRALAILGTDARGADQVWHVPSAPAVTTRRFVEISARLAGTTPRVRTASRLESRLIGLFVPPVREAIEMRYQFDRPFVVDHGKFADTFGDISTPLENALATTLDWARTRKGKAL